MSGCRGCQSAREGTNKFTERKCSKHSRNLVDRGIRDSERITLLDVWNTPVEGAGPCPRGTKCAPHKTSIRRANRRIDDRQASEIGARADKKRMWFLPRSTVVDKTLLYVFVNIIVKIIKISIRY